MSGDRGLFPITRPSAVDGLGSTDPRRRARSRDRIANAYWKPIYKYARVKWNLAPAAAEDLTQEFFTHIIDRDSLSGFDPVRAKFRTFLRACFDRFAIDQHRREHAQRRGGTRKVSLDFGAAESELAMQSADAETIFDAEWVRHLMQLALDRLRRALSDRKPVHLLLFERFHLADELPSYGALAAELGIKVTDVTNWLAYARREFRKSALELLREITASEAEFADEARAVFGIELTLGA